MATQPNTNSSCRHCRTRKFNRHTDTLKPIRIDLQRLETTLSSEDERECRQIYEKLQQLQPNGVCVSLNTLRRALYPPSSISKNKNEQILLLRNFYRQRNIDQLPQLRTSVTPKSNQSKKLVRMNRDQIIQQVNQHAAINYSYYTRTK